MFFTKSAQISVSHDFWHQWAWNWNLNAFLDRSSQIDHNGHVLTLRGAQKEFQQNRNSWRRSWTPKFTEFWMIPLHLGAPKHFLSKYEIRIWNWIHKHPFQGWKCFSPKVPKSVFHMIFGINEHETEIWMHFWIDHHKMITMDTFSPLGKLKSSFNQTEHHTGVRNWKSKFGNNWVSLVANVTILNSSTWNSFRSLLSRIDIFQHCAILPSKHSTTHLHNEQKHLKPNAMIPTTFEPN